MSEEQPDTELLDDSFEDLATRAGASLRKPPSRDQLDRIVAQAQRRRAQRLAVVATGITALVIGFVWFAAKDARGTAPSPATVPSDTTAPSTSTSTAAVLPGESWIAFGLNGPDFSINVVRPDGSGLHAAAPAVASPRQVNPDWSPDGSLLAFAADAIEGTVKIWITTADGGGAHIAVDCTAPCVSVDEPAWSPDGTRLAFDRDVMNSGVLTSTLEVLDVAEGTSTVVRTAPTKTVYLQPRWSPDGRSLVVEVLHLAEPNPDAATTGDGIGVVDLAQPAPDVRMLTDFEHFSNSPDWSRTGDLIVFVSRSVDGSSAGDLFVIRPDGSGRRQLTALAAAGDVAFEPTFTPEATRVLFVRASTKSQRRRLVSVAIDGSGLRDEIPSLTADVYHPRLRPTG